MFAVLLIAATLGVQTPAPIVKNPTAVVFTCADHARDDQHEIDIVNSSGVVVQTMLVGDPPADANGDVVVTINVQPIAFGSYTFVARAVAAAVKSANSTPSDVWDRVPGAPSKPIAK